MIVQSGQERFVIWQLGETLDDIARQVFEVAFNHNHGNLTRTAKDLGICIKTARNKAQSLKLIPRGTRWVGKTTKIVSG